MRGYVGIANTASVGCRINRKAFSPKSEEADGTLSGGQDGCLNQHQTRTEVWVRSCWLEGLTLPGIHQIFSRLGLSLRGRTMCVSPDAAYAEKLSRIQQALEEARENPVVYQDEFSFNLQPTLAKTTILWHARVISQRRSTEMFISKSKAARSSKHFIHRFANAIQTLNASI